MSRGQRLGITVFDEANKQFNGDLMIRSPLLLYCVGITIDSVDCPLLMNVPPAGWLKLNSPANHTGRLSKSAELVSGFIPLLNLHT